MLIWYTKEYTVKKQKSILSQVNAAVKNAKIGAPLHIRNKIDLLEYRKDVLENYANHLRANEASHAAIERAHARFFSAYMRFANVAAKACEQGLL